MDLTRIAKLTPNHACVSEKPSVSIFWHWTSVRQDYSHGTTTKRKPSSRKLREQSFGVLDHAVLEKPLHKERNAASFEILAKSSL